MKYYICRTTCRDGNHEYSDIFLVILDNPIGFFDGSTLDESDKTDEAILAWNYGNCLEDTFNDGYSDGGHRSINVSEWKQIDKYEHDFLAKTLPSILFSEIWKIYQEYEKFNKEEKLERTAA